ncbi:hypothetical protein PCIT_a1894 [Pseudoalteromonas citrea]|uniref:Uncharacterized protein n=1 Tax=Pseudoalteromonas citrea TaxID=43655 RepID=A0AAD4AIW4_9GAMM|nr:hypothetical protein PCIT_a1894 [Pseudoalteromonas citrea]
MCFHGVYVHINYLFEDQRRWVSPVRASGRPSLVAVANATKG